MGDIEQTPALPEDMINDLLERLGELPDLEYDAATAAGFPPREVTKVAFEAGVERAQEAVREWMAGRTVLEPLEPRTQEQWCYFYGGPDPDNSVGSRVTDDEADARESVRWVITLGGKGIARRQVSCGPWEVVDFTSDLLASESSGDGENRAD